MNFWAVVRRAVHARCGHNIKNITYNATFTPREAPLGEIYEAVTLGAGVQWHEACAAVNNYGRPMVGGFSAGSSVGAAGGWLAGGGHSALSPSYGLGVDNALEISVVLSIGEFLVVNKYQNSDLFWALRGGGGSTYGIVTSIAYRTYPSMPTRFYTFKANVTNYSALPELVGGLLRFQTQFTDDGWGGYGVISSQRLSFFYFAPNMTNKTAIATTRAWHNYTASLAQLGVVSAKKIYYAPAFYELYRLLFGGGVQNGGDLMITSRLLSRETVATKYALVAEVLLDCNATFNTIAGGKVCQFAADSAGLNPAWRNAAVETVCGVTWEDGTSLADIQGKIDQLKGWILALYNFAPDDGTYFNEASLFEIDWKKTFFGAHYLILKEVKAKHDPYRPFVVAEGVGSDNWNTNLTCRY